MRVPLRAVRPVRSAIRPSVLRCSAPSSGTGRDVKADVLSISEVINQTIHRRGQLTGEERNRSEEFKIAGVVCYSGA